MSVDRKIRVARHMDLAIVALDDHPGGLTRARLAQLVGVPEQSISRLTTHLRKNATDINRTIVVLKIGGEWIYAWAENLLEHREEQLKRRRNEARALYVSRETLAQSVTEQPNALDLKRQLVDVSNRLAQVELTIEELSGQLLLIKREATAA